jgi:hypothetical protein
VLLVVIPFARDILGLAPLEPSHWVLAVGIALTYLGAVELEKWISQRLSNDELAAALPGPGITGRG